LGELINRISTNHTFFFREKSHFDFFSRVTLPQAVERLKKRNTKDLRIWCAGCATGEEAYTLVMLLLEFFGTQYGAWDAGLLATDISTAALGTAQAGVYPAERTTLIPGDFKRKYFKKNPAGDWAVEDRLKKEIVYRRFNLMNEQFPFKKPFSAIFCRNVMIYFDQPTRDALVRRFYNHTEPGGYLFIGHAESLRRDSCPYEYVEPAIYRKRES
jgi:chemotaxis protein methyltransferase CheR